MEVSREMYAGHLSFADRRGKQSVTNEHELGLPPLRTEAFPRLQQQRKILLRREPANIRHQKVVGPRPELLAPRLGPELRTKLLRIDTPGPDAGIGDATSVQVRLKHPGGAEDAMRVGVEPSEVRPPGSHRRREPATVQARIRFVVGMRAGDDGDAKPGGRRKSRMPHGELRREVRHLGPKGPHVSEEFCRVRKRPVDIRCEKEGPRRRSVYLRSIGRTRGEVVVGRVDTDGVPPIM